MKKIPVWKNIVLIFSLIVTIIIATLAWFYNKPRGEVTDIPVRVGKASYVKISSDKGENWSEDLDIDIGLNKNFKEISGNGTVFMEPVYEIQDDADGNLGYQIVAFNRVTDSQKYFEQTFDFKSDVSQNIYLDPESAITAISENGTSFINGAIRVAFFEIDEKGKENLKCIWAPNSLTEYLPKNDTFAIGGNVEANYYYQKTTVPEDIGSLTGSTANVEVIPTGKNGSSGTCCGYDAQHKYMWSCGSELPQNAPSLLKINVAQGEKEGFKTMKVRVWLEGYDRECVSRISSQRFTMNFRFVAQEANNNE